MCVPDAATVATLHTRCFPDYFSTHAGEPILRRYYAHFAADPDAIAFVAESEQGEIEGMVTGATDDMAVFRRLFRQQGLVLGWNMMIQTFRSQKVRRRLSKLRHWSRLAFRLIRKDSGVKVQPALNDAPTRLIVIAVTSKRRGAGIADRLTAAFCDEAERRGHPRVGLSVEKTNEAAIRFYRRVGWTLVRQQGESLLFEFVRGENRDDPVP